ncbi:MAG TPA: hypothetical protein VJY65_12700 [Chloroflexota bacterium]|nr:hypothetical protein [Chloroflexota bacterium]
MAKRMIQGREVSDAQVQQWADEAEAGYDVEDLQNQDRVIRLTPRELDQVDAALAEEPRVIPELAALVTAVRRDTPRLAAMEPAAH